MSNVTVEKLVTSIPGMVVKGVLTTEQALTKAYAHKQIIVISSKERNMFFFTDKHSFGYLVLPTDFVPKSAGFPMTVVSRPSLPDGQVDTIEKFLQVFHNGQEQIHSNEELVEYLNSLSTK